MLCRYIDLSNALNILKTIKLYACTVINNIKSKRVLCVMFFFFNYLFIWSVHVCALHVFILEMIRNLIKIWQYVNSLQRQKQLISFSSYFLLRKKTKWVINWMFWAGLDPAIFLSLLLFFSLQSTLTLIPTNDSSIIAVFSGFLRVLFSHLLSIHKIMLNIQKCHAKSNRGGTWPITFLWQVDVEYGF